MSAALASRGQRRPRRVFITTDRHFSRFAGLHGYALLDYRRVQAEALAGIPALRRFLDAVAREAGL